MKTLNVDTVLWQKNPFYCHPPFNSRKSDVTLFKTLCDNALTLLADMCFQTCILPNRVDDMNMRRKIVAECDSSERPCRPKPFPRVSPPQPPHAHTTLDRCCAYLTRTLAELNATAAGTDEHSFESTFSSVYRELDELKTFDVNSVDVSDNDCCSVNSAGFQNSVEDNSNRLNEADAIYTFLEKTGLVNFGKLSVGPNRPNRMFTVAQCGGGRSTATDTGGVTFQITLYDRKPTFTTFKPPPLKENTREGHFKPEPLLENMATFEKLEENEAEGSDVDIEEVLSDLLAICEDEDDVKSNESSECVDSLSGSFNVNNLINSDSDEDSGFELDNVISSKREYKHGGYERVGLFGNTILPTVRENDEDDNQSLELSSHPEDDSEESDVEFWKQQIWRNAWYEEEEMPLSQDQWFSSTDNEGRVYFFGENSNTSSWTLPDSVTENSDERKEPGEAERNLSLRRNTKSQSMVLSTSLDESNSLTSLSHHWPQLWQGTMCVLKEGPLNKTKITENGKRVRKNWAPSHAVLTELLLLFFKDNKGFPSMMSGNGRPELSVDLNGTVIDCGEKVSSRKHVYLLSTVLGLQVLIQCESSSAAEQWEAAITAAIHNLPSSTGVKGVRNKTESPVEESKINARIGRSKSMKLKHKSASIEDLSVNSAERQTKIRERLKKFFHRRPTVELLVKKGIWKDEPVFGCQLDHVCPPEPPRVPLFVQQCIRCIESSEENMRTDGLYRASGNLSQVQKIRLQVDQNVYSLLEEEEDVHVLAGTLKLFFRELKQPLIPFKSFNKAIHASTNPNRTEKIREFREIVKSLPSCNLDTLKYLLQHLLRVSQFQEHNRMHIPNIAIVFGPTLMWPQQQSLDMAFDLMQQNLVIECLLSDFHSIFT